MVEHLPGYGPATGKTIMQDRQKHTTSPDKRIKKGRDERRPLDPSWQFDPAWLHDAFLAAIPDYPPPAEPALVELAGALNLWRSYYLAADAARRHNELVDRAERALAELRDILPEIIDRVRDRADRGDPFAAMQQPPLTALVSAIARRPVLERDQLPDYARDWRWLIKADALPAVIERAAGRTLGRTKGGPLARLIAHILPEMTGETRTAIAIGNQLA